MILYTQRLILRPWDEGDAPTLFRYACDPSVGPCAGWPPHCSVQHSLEVIRTVLSAEETYAVVLRETEEPVGSVALVFRRHAQADTDAPEAEIGCWLGAPYWGRGLIPEAIHALLRRCFHVLGCGGVWYAYYDGNLRSKRVQEKLGFLHHHTQENKPCTLLREVRTAHFSYLSRNRYLALFGNGGKNA